MTGPMSHRPCPRRSPCPGLLVAAAENPDSSRLTLRRIFEARRIRARTCHGALGQRRERLHQHSSRRSGRSAVATSSAMTPGQGAAEILVAAELLIPPGKQAPLGLDDYRFLGRSITTADLHKLSARLAHQQSRRLLGARPQQPRVAQTRRRRPPLPRSCTRSSPRTDCGSPMYAPTTFTWKTFATTGSPG